MAPKTAAERMQKMRQRKKQAGMRRLHVWLTPSDLALVKRYIARLAAKHKRALNGVHQSG
jgi:hypothetical protein